jgi:3-oxoacyl-[acyl-carrier protein] reductase
MLEALDVSLIGRSGRTALVVGGGDDVGRAIALALARAGVSVTVHASTLGEADAVVAEARSLGVDAFAALGDVADFDSARSVSAFALEALGSIDILVHCVGIRPHSPVATMSANEWRDVMDTNCSSFFYLAQHVLPGMIERGFGRLIAVGVALDDRSRPQHASVAAARAALRELVKVTAVENGAFGVTANIVSIAITETTKAAVLAPDMLRKLVPIPRPATLEEAASACLYLASEQGAYITGHTLHVDGGYTL